MDVSAHDLVRSHTCVHWGCTSPAVGEGGYCQDGHPGVPRRVLAGHVRLLRDKGVTQQEAARRLGVSRSYVSELERDPDGTLNRARKDGYRRPCPDCGRLMDGANGAGPNAPTRCLSCQGEALHKARYWTPETIVAAFLAFREATGRQPTVTDAMVRHGAPSIAGRLSPERLREVAAIPDSLRLPQPWVVTREVGGWGNALRLAGMEPSPQGGAGHRRTRRRDRMKQFVVLQQEGGCWVERGPVDAHDPSDAIQKVATEETGYVAVPVLYWDVKQVAPRTVFKVVE